MSHFSIQEAAPAMHYQDLGRFGYAHLGLSQGGPIDLHAHCWANYLLENPPNATTIEISYGNTTLEVLSDCSIAISGAEMDAKLDGHPIRNWSSHTVKKGQTLHLNYAQKGIHSYLAVRQGFKAPITLGSSSTVIRNSIGSLLSKDDTLSANKGNSSLTKSNKLTPIQYIPDYDQIYEIHLILPAAQDRALSADILNTYFTISPRSDRMGSNLETDTPLPAYPGIISEGIGLGTVQLPPSGKPIIMLNDRQTQGGYHQIGTIALIDLPRITQARPGTKIRFIPTSLDQSSSYWRDFVRFFGIQNG